jgi:tetratricopeptide (TPR) repeat protein
MTAKKRKAKIAAATTANDQPDERAHLWVVVVLCVVGFCLYANTLTSTFHFDDLGVIVNNPAIRHLDLLELFNAFNTRFLAGLTFAVNYRLGGLDVFGYHFFNIWLHVCNAVLLYTFVQLLLNSERFRGQVRTYDHIRVAAATALLFLVHPIQTQAVNYIWQRATLLAVFFYLMSIVLYLYGRTRDIRSYFVGAVGCCLTAMLCKEIAFTLPFMIAILEFFVIADNRPLQRRWLRILPFLLMLLIIPFLLQRGDISLQLMQPHDLTRGVSEEMITRKEYWLTQVNVIVAYLRLLIWPAGQTIDHDYPLASQQGWCLWSISFGVLSIVAGSAIFYRRGNPLLAFGILWFFLTLSVESLVTSADVLVEHRLYLPMIGLSIAAVSVIDQIFQNSKIMKVAWLSIFLMLSVVTIGRNTVWHDDLELWTDAIQKSPNKARAYNNRGVTYKKLNFINLALEDFSHAITINPRYAEAYYNRGGVYKMKGDLSAAEKDYANVIELEPNNFQGFDARGYVFRRQGRDQEALKDFAASIALNPRNPEVFNNRAYIYQKQGRRDLAIEDYTRAITADPGYAYAYNNRGNLYLEGGEFALAVADYTRAISLKDDFGEPYVNRAVANFRLGRSEQSQSDARRAQALGMKINPEFLRQLGPIAR